MASERPAATSEELVIHKSVTVGLPVERAFELFTERASDWWPFATHSVHGERALAAVFEAREGGRFYERADGGEEAEWGRVLVFEPPHRFRLQWLVDPRCAGEVEVRFTAEGDGTRVELDHRGWEQYGDEAETMMSGYDAGWDHVLGRYADAAGR
jgi:uncharacterized protein YndB with AHSA1/START domain